MSISFNILADVLNESDRAEQKFGVQNHAPADWMLIVGEEYGEAQKEVNDYRYTGDLDPNYRYELVQTAAMALQAIASYDRNEAQLG